LSNLLACCIRRAVPILQASGSSTAEAFSTNSRKGCRTSRVGSYDETEQDDGSRRIFDDSGTRDSGLAASLGWPKTTALFGDARFYDIDRLGVKLPEERGTDSVTEETAHRPGYAGFPRLKKHARGPQATQRSQASRGPLTGVAVLSIRLRIRRGIDSQGVLQLSSSGMFAAVESGCEGIAGRNSRLGYRGDIGSVVDV